MTMTMSKPKQRRLGNRYVLKIPIRVRVLDDSGRTQEEICEVLDVSGTGAYFLTRLPIHIKQEINVSLPLPRRMRLIPTADPVFKCRARVVRVQTNLPNFPGKLGVAVKFLVYKTTPRMR